MGVTKLTSFAEAHKEQLSTYLPLDDSVSFPAVVIDTGGLAFELAHHAGVDERVFGDTEKVYAALKLWVAALRRLSPRLVFVFDGFSPEARDETIRQRKIQRVMGVRVSCYPLATESCITSPAAGQTNAV